MRKMEMGLTAIQQVKTPPYEQNRLKGKNIICDLYEYSYELFKSVLNLLF